MINYGPRFFTRVYQVFYTCSFEQNVFLFEDQQIFLNVSKDEISSCVIVAQTLETERWASVRGGACRGG